MLSGLFSTGCTLDLAIDYQKGRKTCFLNREKKGERAYVFADEEEVTGTAVVTLKPGRKLDHLGIRVELVGEIQLLKDATAPYSFFTMSKDLESPGTLYESQMYKWRFHGADTSHETYWGANVRLRYFVRLSVVRQYAASLTKEVDFAVQNPVKSVASSGSIKMEVGIEGCLHIEFEYDKNQYHLKDVVIGKVYFLLVRIKIKYMELDIVKTETVKVSGQQHTTTETVTKFELMDGAAVKSECIPVRLYLSGYDLTPTYNNVQNKYSVKYFLNLVLVDEEDRRYFKRQEITLYRKSPDPVAV